ncbi:hypothetical protein A2331_01950 [Candidatus Falkowbacteria bacterium RIFOXYB2_FULL_34_18]|uniref:Uncharacterized protein n=1 Tax=Candidatus Falkowbacteria bacterium RIFOXYD2_FULL_34_120 TaxID=1798007 RepID=A0A1F5TQE6_9BACT|nr:MAG: hypothetical protein A2331_01950 [Candidatus Falkowbacteria bacterium RIFOXYB2_FULL_34_18]OGF29445.1 MAG: hypothetical protein A2500_01015 [Candidatus Falkowbacteria bacterium RIFOXYC12_FULL_34_55]OGF36758.1 MAG: hypothetical protein A2466_03325 [Candidatus Falkowbacteria bacterium RIFOXYC2_FULL_34_220]OGF38971.1 MAG: hypothetical protein A2515_05440 [Candidatus Falkowbacteria bacterium RIFOXYD12_FULL_34_57]OGF41163.1 MAG: hypothetical protein A2531_01440 [Candidatus Falkowbacteria bact
MKKKKNKNETWKKFYFNGKLAWGKINSKNDWIKIVKTYNGNINLLRNTRLQASASRNCPFFNYYKNSGSITLGEWADKNGINLTI